MTELDNRLRIYQAGIKNYGYSGLEQELNRLEAKKQGYLRAYNLAIAKYGVNDPKTINDQTNLQEVNAMQSLIMKMPSMQVKPTTETPPQVINPQEADLSLQNARTTLANAVSNREEIGRNNQVQTDQFNQSYYGNPTTGVPSVSENIIHNYATRGLGQETATPALVNAQNSYSEQLANLQKSQDSAMQGAANQQLQAENGLGQANIEQDILRSDADFRKQIAAGNKQQVIGVLQGWVNDLNPLRKKYAEKMLSYLQGGNANGYY